MQLDFEVRSCSRTCSETQRSLQPGDVYFSVLIEQETELLRHDYSAEVWGGPPDECLGWWRSRIPESENTSPKLAPADVMLNLFVALEKRPQEFSLRYMLGLLLLRRRVLRCEETRLHADGGEVLSLFCPRRNEDYELTVAEPDDQEAEAIQQRMIDLVYGDSETVTNESADLEE
jgi:hypothetical protein